MKMENEHWTFFFFACHFLKPLKFFWCTKMEISTGKKTIFLGGDFLTSPTFECTPGYTPVHHYTKCTNHKQCCHQVWNVNHIQQQNDIK